MEESSTYQYILSKGVAVGALKGPKKFILSVGRHRFGPPDAETEKTIEAITDMERLEQLALRLLDVSSWQELLTPPT